MKVKTAELKGAQLDWAVAKCEGVIWAAPDGELLGSARGMNYSTDWAQCGPIIEREGMQICCNSKGRRHWVVEPFNGVPLGKESHGPTALIAAMRCYVASKVGDEVEVPDGLT